MAPSPAEGAATRAEYVAQAEPICITAEQQAKRRAKKQVKQLKKAAARLDKRFGALEEDVIGDPDEISKADLRKLLGGIARLIAKVSGPTYKIFDRATNLLRAIPPAPGDEAAITAWLAGRTRFTRVAYRGVRGGRHGKFKRLFGTMFKAEEALRNGQAPVNAFGFQHCFIELPEIGIGPAPFFGRRKNAD